MNPTCNHEPDWSKFTCKLCEKLIESEDCESCDGSGLEIRSNSSHLACRSCGGTGVGKWRLIDDGSAASA